MASRFVQRRWLAVACVALLACVARTRIPDEGAGRALRVMTYNIESGRGALDGTVAAIRASAPDVVGLQEVDVHWAERSGFADQAAILGERLGMEVRFARIYEIPNDDPARPPRQFGVALLSRFPVVSWRNDTLM